MAEAPPSGESESSAGTERVRKIVAVVGNSIGAVALAVAIAALVAILWFTREGVSISDVFEDDRSGSTTTSFPILMLFLSMIGFFFGQFASRGRWGVGENMSAWSSGTFRIVLNPTSVALHTTLWLLAILAWVLVLPFPVYLDVVGKLALEDGSSSARQFWFAAIAYGAIAGAIASVVFVSLLKKLTYNRLLDRNRASIVDGSATQVAWRRFSHIWRGELMVAAVAGGALGLAPVGFHVDSSAYVLSFAAAGVGLLIASIVMALNAWRSGLPVERVESYT
ncbi:hypothetical protein D9V28_00285 [Mycetocola zhadangensis]|uniref:Uncharacterized protein n=2 Tax=Mycetocola zhadangensis TaxID=1164595 RepID=A0A3L7J7E1_9MICO|nr:hypothetical protein D9V28_00285 [Mycetocola zhadangensis]